MSKKQLLLTLALLVPAVLALTLALQGILRQMFALPLAYAIAALALVVRSLPQAIVWAVFLSVAILIAARSLLQPSRRAQERAHQKSAPLSRVEHWSVMVSQTEHGRYLKWRLAKDLGELALHILAHLQRLPPGSAEETLASGELPLTREMRSYLKAGLMERSLNAFSTANSKDDPQHDIPALDFDPEILIHHLESLMEVDREDGD